MVNAADQLAAHAGIGALDVGGSAADAIVAAAAVMAVTSPHLCGMGGDALAMVRPGTTPRALLAIGRAGSASTPWPCGPRATPRWWSRRFAQRPGPWAVDGWLALLERYGRLPHDAVFAPAIELAEGKFGRRSC